LALGEGRFHRATSGDIVIEQDDADTAEKLSVPARDAPDRQYRRAAMGKLLVNLNNALMRWPTAAAAGSSRSGRGGDYFRPMADRPCRADPRPRDSGRSGRYARFSGVDADQLRLHRQFELLAVGASRGRATDSFSAVSASSVRSRCRRGGAVKPPLAQRNHVEPAPCRRARAARQAVGAAP